MEIQVQELLESIKKDGIDQAESSANEIIRAAEEKAAGILADAEKRSSELRSQAEREAAQLKASGEAALKQAARDTVLSVRSQLESVFKLLVKTTVTETFKKDVLEKAIVELVKSWAGKAQALVLSAEDEKALASSLKGKIGEALKDGLQVQTSSKLNGGFLVQEKGGAAYYDFSDEALASALAVYLNPVLSQIMSESGK